MKSGAKNAESGKENGVESDRKGLESVVQSEVELARSWEGFSRSLNEVCAFAGIYLPSFSSKTLLPYSSAGQSVASFRLAPVYVGSLPRLIHACQSRFIRKGCNCFRWAGSFWQLAVPLPLYDPHFQSS